MLRNKLLDEMFGTDPNNEDRPDESRCTGRSTSIGLALIVWCIQNPGLERVVTDHHGTRLADQLLAERIRGIIAKLDLKFFTVTKLGNGQVRMRCDLWREE